MKNREKKNRHSESRFFDSFLKNGSRKTEETRGAGKERDQPQEKAREEKESFRRIRERVLSDPVLSSMPNEELKQWIFGQIETDHANVWADLQERMNTASRFVSELRGFGILDRLLQDEGITEILIHRYDDISIEQNGRLIPISEKFESEEKLQDVIQRIVGLAGKEINQSRPMVDAVLPDGSRVNATLPPVSLLGAGMTIRKFSKKPLEMIDLARNGAFPPEMMSFFMMLVCSRYNIFICGGTDSGKTTFMNALMQYIPRSENLVVIEDSPELKIPERRNLSRLLTREPNTAGEGAITIRDLIRNSLRMRPDRIVVGEVRGEETLDMLQAMNTGHDGSLSTGHASSCANMISRLETMVLQGSARLPLTAVRSQIASAIDIIIFLSKDRGHVRRVMEIAEVTGIEDGDVRLNTLYRYQESMRSGNGIRKGGMIKVNDMIDTEKMRRACFIKEEPKSAGSGAEFTEETKAKSA